MRYKKRLALILFVILFQTFACAGGITNIINLPGFVVLEHKVYETTTQGQPFFLFSNVTFKNEHIGSMAALFSAIEINGKVSGDVLAFSSDITLGETGGIDGFYFTMPKTLLKLAASVMRILALLIIVSFNKSYFEQGCGACISDKGSILRIGITAYFFTLALCLIFLFAVVTYPFSILIFFLSAALSLCGEVSLGMYIGYVLLSKRKRPFQPINMPFLTVRNFPFNSFANIAIGGIIIESFTFIPYFGFLYSYFILPVICIGIIGILFLNAVLYKKFYNLPYNTEDLSINRVRDILTEGLE